MRGLLRLLALALVAAAPALLAPLWPGGAAGAAAPEIAALRLGLHPGLTRVVVDLSDEAPYRVYPLSDPPRMVIDLAGADFDLPDEAALAPTGVVAGARLGRPEPALSRITLDLTAAAELEQVQLLPGSPSQPYRLVIDLSESDGASAQLAEAAELPMVLLPLPPRKPATSSGVAGDSGKPLVVIDPGHGGIDPGAISPSGVEEKAVTLAVAKELRGQLLATGRYRVQLTRQDDRFIPLRERFELAQQAGASLFVSLHADSHKNPNLRGASVYTLSEKASDAETAALAAKENKSDLLGGVEYPEDNAIVGNILLDLTRFETLTYSGQFAKQLVNELARDTLLLRNTQRSAGFAVLKAPDIPSVLVELGYLSNNQDESLLQSAKHKTKLAAAISRAIESYFEAHPQEARLSRP